MDQQQNEADSDLIDEAEAAKILNVSVFTLRNWRSKKRGPAWVKYPRAVRYRRSDLRVWLDANTRSAFNA